MIRPNRVVVSVVSLIGLSAIVFLSIQAFAAMTDAKIPDKAERKVLWKQVDAELEKGLPESAIKTLQKIYDSAVADKDHPEASLALCRQFLIEGQKHEPMVPYIIKKLQTTIPTAPEGMQPVLKTILAEWFYSYYMQNQWRFQQRTEIAAEVDDDFETWSLPRLLDEVDFLFTAALANSDELKKISVADYTPLIEKRVSSNADDDSKHALRPALFDFIAFRAINFYSLDEQFIRGQGAFEVSADSPIFSDRDTFLGWKPETTDDDSYVLRAVSIYQDIIRFHLKDDDRWALLDADLSRLVFGKSVATGSDAETTARYQAALQRFADKEIKHPLSSTALAHLATSLQTEEKLVEAIKIAKQGLARFPNSNGADLCHNIIESITAKSASVTTERVWSKSESTIDVRYKNINKAYFKLIPFDFESWKKWGDYRSVQNIHDENERRAILNKPPVANWSVDLPTTDDYKERTERIPVETNGVPSGCYIVVCSHTPEFTEKDNVVSLAEVWVSDLAVVIKQSSNNRTIEGWVVNADSGLPLSGVGIQRKGWKYDGRNSRETGQASTETDKSGAFSLAATNRNELSKLYFTYKDQKFGLIEHLYSHSRGIRGQFENTVFFTDRSIYRPGQTISFKGICTTANQEQHVYKTIPGRSVTVILYDVNNQEIEKRDFKTNEFGSFTGSFTAPRDRATGMMRIQCQNPGGAASIRVEEYKRPKFYVEIDKPSEAFQLGQEIKMTGNATAYTGAPIDGSKVVWRVVRNVRYSGWYRSCFWYLPFPENPTEIANGEMETNAEGKFEITFTAEPDNSVDRKSDPVFIYTVYADVTDSAGETRSSSQSTTIGYRTLEASLTAKNWLVVDEPIEVKLGVTTLDGEGQKSMGKLTVYALTPPEKIQRAELQQHRHWNPIVAGESKPDLSKINAWPTGDSVLVKDLGTDAEGAGTTEIKLPAGAYKAVFETNDPAGQVVKAELPLLIIDPAAGDFSVSIPNHFQAKDQAVEPGDEFVAVWGTGYEIGRALIELEHRGKLLKSYWTDAGTTQATIKVPIEEIHRGGLHVRVTYVRENRMYSENHKINVPWTNKKLTVKWEHFVSKLEPGGKETWTAVVSGPDSAGVVAEIVAGMYDASLDAFAPHNWMSAFNVFYQDYASSNMRFFNNLQHFNAILHGFRESYRDGSVVYPQFNPQLGIGQFYGRVAFAMGGGLGGGGGLRGERRMSGMMAPQAAAIEMEAMSDSSVVASGRMMSKSANAPADKSEGSIEGTAQSFDGAPRPDLKDVPLRKNLQETAFFFPNLVSDDDGSVRITFEIPEALTKWKVMGFAHDNELRAGLLTDEMTTSKDLMIQPNPPRFLREGDLLEFSVKVVNQSDQPQTGNVKLTFADARTGENMDKALSNKNVTQSFEIPAKQSTSLYWKISVPDFVGVLTYKAVGATEKLSDGEEGFLPVLSKRILVTESLPLPIRGNQTKKFNFDSLLESASSKSLKSQTLTVQMTSNPSWYAVMALPYLMEYPHECSEQVFNRLYANAVGKHIVNSDPKIERVFAQWRNTPALDSPLEKNEDLRNVMIAESPWLLAAKKESQARRDVGILFDKNRLNNEQQRAITQLAEMQLGDGAWPWFPGGRANDYITLYVTTGFGRLRHLGIEVDMTAAFRAVDRLDWFVNERYKRIKPADRDQNHLDSSIALYLYGRSFFLKDQPVNDQYRVAFDYWVSQAKKYWVKLGNRQSQGHIALGLKRIGDNETPADILKSLTERALMEDEMGMFWREGEASWWWYRAPIETQALMIEVYDEVANDAEKVEELKIWLLKQKQTQNWKTTKATADACYGLLLRGTDRLASDKLVEVNLGGIEIEPGDIEAGTGFYEQKFIRGEIKPSMGKITVTKKDDGIAWGSVHWQYLEDVGNIKPYEGTPLTLKKALFIKNNTPDGPKITPVTSEVKVGDELVTRVEIRVDRAMEYVHLKDYRGSGTEPVNVLSQYKFQDGLAYYESTKDTASHFFIDYLPRGTYVFEYSVRVQHRGVYETGIAELQCMYAPEFNSHSGSVEITVK